MIFKYGTLNHRHAAGPIFRDSLASLGAGSGSASADIILFRIPALLVPLQVCGLLS